MSELLIPKDRIGGLNDLLLRSIDPTFHRVNRYNHGFAEGVIATLDIVYDEKHPKLDVPEYTEELTAKANLGYEALKLIEEYLAQPDNVPSTSLADRMERLVDAWKVNTFTKTHLPEVKAEHREYARLQLPDGHTTQARSLMDLMAIGDVAKATEDYGRMFFRRLGTIEREGRRWLYAEFVDSTGAEQGRTRIGELIGNSDYLNLPQL